MKIPQLILNSSKNWFALINLILLLVTALNKQLGNILKLQWLEISPWWSLLFIGILLIWWLMNAIYEHRQELYVAYKAAEDRAIKAEENFGFMSLKEACEKLNEGLSKLYGDSYARDFDSLRPHEQLSDLVKYFVEVDDIYGKSPSQSFTDWIIINKAKFILGEIKIEEGEMVFYGPGNYVDKTPDYVSLAIRKGNVTDDINNIIDSFFILLKDATEQLYNECRKRPLCNRFLEEHIVGQFTTRNEAWRVLADHFVYNSSINIYGKDKYSTELKEINKDRFGSLYFNNEASDLFIFDSKEPTYTGISVKKDEVKRAIREIIELTEGIYTAPTGRPI